MEENDSPDLALEIFIHEEEGRVDTVITGAGMQHKFSTPVTSGVASKLELLADLAQKLIETWESVEGHI